MERPETQNPFKTGTLIKADCPIQEYLNSKGGRDGEPRILSRSDLCQIAVCPSRWHNGYQPEDRRTPSIEFGSLLDCLLLQPHKLGEYYKLAPKTYTNAKGKEAAWTWRSSTCRFWRDAVEAKGMLACSEEDMKEASNAVEAVMFHPLHGEQITRLVTNSTHQVFCIAEYHDRETGIVVPVKCLTDIVPNPDDPDFGKSLFDLKTAVSAHPRAWQRAVFDGDYHIQGALNLDIYCAATGEDRQDFRHLIIENFAPWEMARRFLSMEFIEIGRWKVIQALRTYCQALQTGEWPSYTNPAALTLPDGFEACDPDHWMVQ